MRQTSGSIPDNERALVSSILHEVTGFEADAIDHIKGLGNRGKLCHEAHKPMVVGPP
jgi:hypothetical protein